MITVPNISVRPASRLLTRREFDRAQTLIDHAMRPGIDLSMADDFPLLVGKMARSERRVISDASGAIVAHAAMRRMEVMCPTLGTRIVLANIGAVATAEAARGRGYAKAIVRDLLDSAHRTGALAAILWTSLEGFYESIGFTAIDGETRYGVARSRLPRAMDIEARRMNANDVSALLHLRGRDPAPIQRTPAEARALFALPHSRTYVAQKAGTIAAYLVIGKGLDFVDVVHEWAGDPEVVGALMREALFAEGLERSTILGPSRHRPFTRTFGAIATTMERAPIGWLAALDRPRLRSMLGAADSVTDDHALLNGVFGTGNANGGDSSPPVPLYVWGLDSM